MATIIKEILVAAQVDAVWDAVRDVGAAHQRLFPGVLLDARMDDDARVVTFADGLVARELIVTVDDEQRRFVYAAIGGRAKHHNSSIQAFPDEQCTRLVWITDLLPNEMAEPIRALIDQGARAMKLALERDVDINRG